MKSDEGARVTYTGEGRAITLFLWFSAFIIGGFFGLGLSLDSEFATGPRLGGLALIAVAVVLVVIGQRCRSMGIELDESTLVVRNPLRTTRIALRDVRAIDIEAAGSSARLVVQTATGTVRTYGLIGMKHDHALDAATAIRHACGDGIQFDDDLTEVTLVKRPVFATVTWIVTIAAIVTLFLVEDFYRPRGVSDLRTLAVMALLGFVGSRVGRMGVRATTRRLEVCTLRHRRTLLWTDIRSVDLVDHGTENGPGVVLTLIDGTTVAIPRTGTSPEKLAAELRDGLERARSLRDAPAS